MLGNHPFYVLPEVFRYGEADEGEFLEKLIAIQADTRLDHLSAATQLQMDDHGTTGDGYRLTLTAFKQTCKIARKGLDNLVEGLCGHDRAPDESRSDFSITEAVKIYNMVVRRSFDNRFLGQQRLIRNIKAKRIEGLLGPKYNYLENRAVYDMAVAATAGSCQSVRFREAQLWGRRMMMRFAHQKPLFAIAAPTSTGVETFYGGYEFSNSEIGGEASVRATTLLLRAADDTASLGNFFGGGKLAHTGKPSQFIKKLNRMFAALMSAEQDGPELARRMDGLRRISLKLGGQETECDQQIDYLSLVLHRFGIPRGFSRKIVLSAAHYGSNHGIGIKPPDRDMLAARTAYDLYNALTREARGLNLGLREIVEQAAYAILMGKVRLK